MMLSIIITVFNSKDYLEECLVSVLNQSYTDFELILIDDGSTDESVQICKNWQEKDKRIRFEQNEHKGLFYARKRGVELAVGDYITFVDPDDFIDCVAYELAEKDMCQQVEVIAFDYMRYEYGEEVRYCKDFYEQKIYNRQDISEIIFPSMIWDDVRRTTGLNSSLWNKIFKAELIKACYMIPWGVHFCFGEDIIIVFPAIARASSVSIHHEAYYYHRERPQNVYPEYFLDKAYLDKLYELYKYLSEIMSAFPGFQKQIDLLYTVLALHNNKKYNYDMYIPEIVFPFDKVEKGSKIIIYGAGNVGRYFIKQLRMIDYCKCTLWVDEKYDRIGGEVHDPKEILAHEFDAIVVAILDSKVRNQVMTNLISLNIDKAKIILV